MCVSLKHNSYTPGNAAPPVRQRANEPVRRAQSTQEVSPLPSLTSTSLSRSDTCLVASSSEQLSLILGRSTSSVSRIMWSMSMGNGWSLVQISRLRFHQMYLCTHTFKPSHQSPTAQKQAGPPGPYLEVDEETVELLLAGAAVEVLPAGVQQGADQPDPEQVLRGVQGAGAAVLVHPEGGEGEQGAEDDGRLHHAVVVELAQELGAADPPLVELGLIDLESQKTTRIIIHLCLLVKYLTKFTQLKMAAESVRKGWVVLIYLHSLRRVLK